MGKKRKGVSRMGIAIPMFPERYDTHKKRIAKRKTSPLATATADQLREINEITKRDRGIGNLTLKDLFKED